MKLSSAPPILSRIILAVSAICMVGVVFIFVSRALEPANIIPAAPPKKAEVFNPKADVSQNPSFNQLQEAHMEPVPDMPMGRPNPFDSIVESSERAGSAEGIAVPRSKLQIVPVATTTAATGTQAF